ncbi:MAG TPA: ABC transporter permease [Planctomycetota bacterium]|nr:ABC transporter permease [Planctomycetota bacterium]OQC22107.1 MAG: Macrolide export ATP-binding/permease protein MacB [Planctomycetes bacterium ADurb.Bin069]NMD35675.1 FtsX-like permease family protein [Planctomycetota bacterium]HNR98010.1 ABC transporter permease [Planctomycetota bacterium]HNU25759.1 ABC transporter permease [Planctomycetota bacterium]
MWLHRVLRTVRLGSKSLMLHKLRSSLTVLGIVFGVSSVIAMLSIGEGARWEQEQEIKRLGSDNIILRSVKPPEDRSMNVANEQVIEYGLKYDDLAQIRQTVPTVRGGVPARITRQEARFGETAIDARIVGTSPEFLKAVNASLDAGRFLAPLDDEEPVCVIGATIKGKLFPVEDPLGRDIQIGMDFFRIIGVMSVGGGATGAGSGVAAEDRNRDVYLPLGTMINTQGDVLIRRSSGSMEAERVELHQVIVNVSDVAQVEPSANSIRHILSRNHAKQDYEVVVPLELLRQAERTQRIFQIVLGSIAAISLLVGGIGIMNIMLASVTERTREIGIRRALGARRQDIVVQFLVETIVLSTSGGLFGLFLGISIPLLVQHMAGMRTIVTLTSLLLSFCISVSVGLIFGIYPARRAAALDPIEALRHE